MPRLLFHLLALALLAAGLCLPWVVMDSLPQRAANFAALELLAGGENLPPFLRQALAERGFRPGLPPQRLWSLVGRDAHALQFALVARRERLFAWDFLRVPTTLSVKVAVVAGLAAVVVAVVWLRPRPAVTPAVGGWLAAAAGAVALLVIVTTPLLDSFGFADAWGLAWLDVLSGARATVAPRALLPLGLLALAALLVWPREKNAGDRPAGDDGEPASRRWE